MQRLKRGGFSLMLLAGLLGGLLTTAGPASAQTVHFVLLKGRPDLINPPVCGGDVCEAMVSHPTGTTAVIEVWANTYSFDGNLEIITPIGTYQNSKDQWWYSGSSGKNFTVGDYSGNYEAIAWQKTGSATYTEIGDANMNL